VDEIRVIGQSDVESLLDHDELMAAVATALGQLSAGESSVPPRIATFTEHGLIAAMPGYLPGSPAAVKLVSVFPGNAEHDRPTHQAIVVVFDPATGTPRAIMDGTAITARRTAATSAVAAQALVRPRPRVLAILGAGVQGQAHLDVMRRVFELDEVRIASRTPGRAATLAADEPGARAVFSFEEAVRDADVVCCCTDAREPIVELDWLKRGSHVSSVGTGNEVDAATVAASNVFVEWRGAVTSPPPAGATELQGLHPDDVTEIGEVLAGTRPGRRSAGETTLFKSTGHAAEDVAAASVVLRRALAAAIGTAIRL
jgi:ornithine cyclodeaminase/alanine dehydrogenase-like protein (mu-crystallin family)